MRDSVQPENADAVQGCAPCRWADAAEFCDHTATEVNLAYALARWVTDDPEVTDDDLAGRACAFLDDGAGDDVRQILRHVEGDETTVWTVVSLPDLVRGDIETAFAVNGVEFVVEFQQEGPGVVRPAATWRPECDYCGEPVAEIHDDICARCKAEEEADAVRGR